MEKLPFRWGQRAARHAGEVLRQRRLESAVWDGCRAALADKVPFSK